VTYIAMSSSKEDLFYSALESQSWVHLN
jgi:hypothetical protein